MNIRGMGCALSIHQKECENSLGCALFIGVRYLPENTVPSFLTIKDICYELKKTVFFLCSVVECKRNVKDLDLNKKRYVINYISYCIYCCWYLQIKRNLMPIFFYCGDRCDRVNFVHLLELSTKLKHLAIQLKIPKFIDLFLLIVELHMLKLMMLCIMLLCVFDVSVAAI
jgi:hypothetical protein